MELVEVTEKDFPEWRAFRKSLYEGMDDAENDAEVQVIYESDSWYCWIVKDDQGQNIGLVELASRNIVDGCLSSPVAYLEGLYLEPAYRGQGLGKQIIKDIIDRCAEQGYSELATDTELLNTRAQAFYDAAGFEETDRIVQYRIEV